MKPSFHSTPVMSNGIYSSIHALLITISRTICLAVALYFSIALSAAGAEPVPPEALMRANYEATLVDDSTGTATMTLTLPNGQVRTRDLSSWTKRRPGTVQNMRVTRFEKPADVKGTATLLIENASGDDDVWVYLPALKRSRRVIADQKKDSFMGSDLSYGDVVGYKVSEWTHRIAGTSEQDGRPCTLVESVPVGEQIGKSSGYSRRESCIDAASRVATRIRTWDANGRELKLIEYKALREVDAKNAKWHAMRIEAQNLQTKSRTLIEVREEQVNTGLSDELFSASALEREE
ncbi:MAG: outer membrane lipoprotein-sorting protein [Panacagrimonas sp.]